jgi:uncharacterized protein
MKCPKCSIDLKTREIQHVEVDECEKCEGVWFEHDELRKVKDNTDNDLNWMDFDILKHRDRFKAKGSNYKCPNCSAPMYVLDYDSTKVEIDYCSNCQGIWLDKNELQNIIDALENELVNKSLGDYVRATVEEAKELITHPEGFLSEWKDFTTIIRFLEYRILSLKPVIHDTLVKFQENPLNR